ncbi:MAG: GNAT family N-acetyltransferase [Bacteroidales bacterium]|nr:GNAT family N-acetyltransferase [Bacteroidales bacterium]
MILKKGDNIKLTVIPITEDFGDLNKVDALAKEAFPPIEYPGLQKVMEMSQKHNADFLSIYDKSDFVGFITVLKYKNLAYLYFLAVQKELRSKGYGSAILNMLKDIYPGYTQVVDLEKQDELADNAEQRKKRLAFYMRNGYKRTGFFAKYCGMDLEILCASEHLDPELVKGALENAGLDDFYPEYYYQEI